MIFICICFKCVNDACKVQLSQIVDHALVEISKISVVDFGEKKAHYLLSFFLQNWPRYFWCISIKLCFGDLNKSLNLRNKKHRTFLTFKFCVIIMSNLSIKLVSNFQGVSFDSADWFWIVLTAWNYSDFGIIFLLFKKITKNKFSSKNKIS